MLVKNSVFKLADLPNLEDFQFIAVYHNGTEKEQKVKKTNGLHHIDNFKEIKEWKRKLKKEKNLL